MRYPELDKFAKDMDVKVGNDAEFFLIDKYGNFRSSIGIVGGSKKKPSKTKHGWVQEDNVAAEINIRPARSVEEFIKFTTGVTNDLSTIIRPLNLQVAIVPSALFDNEQLNTIKSREAGCDPDWNAYTMEENPAPDLTSTNLRVAGGHIHISWKNVERGYEDRLNVVKNGDFFITMPGLLIDRDQDRRKLYGKAGAFRPKEYGVELRSPSNFWAATPKLMEWVYYGAVRAVKHMDDQLPNVEDIINNNDVDEAIKMIKKYNIPMPELQGGY